MIPRINGSRAFARTEKTRLIALENEREQARNAAKLDAFVQTFVNMTPAQVDTYVQANITDLASAKTLLRKMALMLLLLAKKEFKD